MWKCGESVHRPRVVGPGLAAFRSPDSYTLEYRLRRRCPQSNRAGGQPLDGVIVGFRVGFRGALSAWDVVTQRGCLGMGGYWLRRSGRRSGPMGVT